MSDLQRLFEMQRQLQLLYGHNFEKMNLDDRETYTRDTILYLSEEAHELLREINFKTYKKTKKPVNVENIKEELADILHFYINLCLVWSVPPDQLVDAFLKKNEKNVQRIRDSSY